MTGELVSIRDICNNPEIFMGVIGVGDEKYIKSVYLLLKEVCSNIKDKLRPIIKKKIEQKYIVKSEDGRYFAFVKKDKYVTVVDITYVIKDILGE